MRFFNLLSLLFFICSCQPLPRNEVLIGAWKVDSTYMYYNRFSYTDRKGGPDWAVYVYDSIGVMKEVKFDSYQTYFYELKGDSMMIRPTQGGDDIRFEILELEKDRLILKKKKQPVFKGENQERYEIRFLSRTVVPEGLGVPFTDPRK